MSARDLTEAQRDALELVIDTHLIDLREEMRYVQEWTPELVGYFLRAAYGKGVVDALRHPDEACAWMASAGYDGRGRRL